MSTDKSGGTILEVFSKLNVSMILLVEIRVVVALAQCKCLVKRSFQSHSPDE